MLNALYYLITFHVPHANHVPWLQSHNKYVVWSKCNVNTQLLYSGSTSVVCKDSIFDRHAMIAESQYVCCWRKHISNIK